MIFEKQIVDYICDTRFDDLPREAVDTIKKMLLADIGTTIAGAQADGCRELAEFYRYEGGRREATVLIHGDKLPAHNAVFVNAMMSRALDFCDAIAPGPHIGSSIIPAALACSEVIGGGDGKEFLASLVVGAEIAARFNLSESAYDGFDPTGICVPFGTAAVACRLLGLDKQQTWNALGLVFNSCGGSFQSHIDGSLGVRVNQGWVTHEAVTSARLAQRGITGPKNFLTGIYGYLHLYGKGQFAAPDMVEGLGHSYRLREVAFKKYPCCAMTSGPTDVAITMLRKYDIEPSKIASVKLTLPPYGFRLVGHNFKIGDNPTVDGQFSAQYCVANVLLRNSSKLRHFTSESVCDPDIKKYISLISVHPDPDLNKRGHTAMDMEMTTTDGTVYKYGIDVAPGFPGNALTSEDHVQRFMDCIDFGSDWFDVNRSKEIMAFIENIETASDILGLVQLLTDMNSGIKSSTA